MAKRSCSEIYAKMCALDEEKSELMKEYLKRAKEERDEDEKRLSLPYDLETLCQQWRDLLISQNDIQEHCDAHWSADAKTITFEGNPIFDLVMNMLEDIEDNQACIYFDLVTCQIKGPFRYSNDEEMQVANALKKTTHIQIFAK